MGDGDVKLFKQGGQEVLIHRAHDVQLFRRPPGPGGDGDIGNALTLDGPGHNHTESGGEEIQRRAADGLVCLQVDGAEGQQQGEEHTGDPGNERRQRDAQLGGEHAFSPTGGVQCPQEEGGSQSADDHDALQRQVDHAGPLRVHATQSHQHQRDCKANGQVDNTGPGTYAHFAAASFFPFLFRRFPSLPDRSIRSSRANARPDRQ